MGVRVVIPDEHGRVCLVQHTYAAGWYLPGGGVRRHEDPGDAIARELREETGMTLMTAREFGTYVNTREGKRDHIIVYIGHAHGPARPASSEIAACGWYPPDRLPGGTSPGTRRRLDEWQAEAPAAGTW